MRPVYLCAAPGVLRMTLQETSLIGQAALVALQAGWLTIGAWGNIRHPEVNRAMVADVMSMRPLRDQPDLFGEFGGYRVECQRAHRRLYAAIVAAESVVALALWASVGMLLIAALGQADPETARVAAALSVIGFTGVWGAFLVGGEWFRYWTGFGEAQKTHFLMTIWGVATFAALT
jgi:predicted small integral membrane protein